MIMRIIFLLTFVFSVFAFAQQKQKASDNTCEEIVLPTIVIPAPAKKPAVNKSEQTKSPLMKKEEKIAATIEINERVKEPVILLQEKEAKELMPGIK